MNKTFRKHNFLTAGEIQELWQIYHNSEVRYAHQDYSLHHVERRDVRKEHLTSAPLAKICQHYHNLNFAHLSSYFLKYSEYSWTRPHHDDLGFKTQTCITLLEEKDLEGGETLVWDTHYDLPTPEGHYVKRSGSSHRKNEIVCTPKLEPGQSLSYSDNVKHGVAQVRAGHRIVLVSWFRQK